MTALACSFPVQVRAGSGCEDKVELRPGVARLNGEDGVWLSQRDANRVFFVLSECLPAYRALVARYRDLDAAQVRLADTSSRTLGLSRELLEDERQRAEFWKQAHHAEREDRRSWTTSPVLWLALGVAAGGAVAVGAAHALRGAR